jgi:hypothetical protein
MQGGHPGLRQVECFNIISFTKAAFGLFPIARGKRFGDPQCCVPTECEHGVAVFALRKPAPRRAVQEGARN